MYGLVLEGGGAKGAFHIGAYRALQDMNIEINAIAGTSIGALNGAMIVQGDFEEAYRLWYNIKPSKVFDVDDDYYQQLKNFNINRDNIVYLLKKTRKIMNNRGLDVTKIRCLLEKYIDEDKLRGSAMELGIVTISLSEMKPLELFVDDIPRGKVIDYLLASANLPAFKLEKLDGQLFLDGGFYDNLPLKLLTQKGYKKIIAIRTYGMGRIRDIKENGLDITYVNPSQYLGRVLDFDQQQARKNLLLGYFDTLQEFKGLKGSKYYIDSSQNDEYFMEFFLNLGRANIQKIGSLLGLQQYTYRRALFEEIIPRLAEMMNLKKSSGYKDIAIAICEEMAEELDIEEFEVYTFSEFLQIIIDNYQPVEVSEINYLPDFIKSSELLSRTVRDKLLTKIKYIIFNKLKQSRR